MDKKSAIFDKNTKIPFLLPVIIIEDEIRYLTIDGTIKTMKFLRNRKHIDVINGNIFTFEYYPKLSLHKYNINTQKVDIFELETKNEQLLNVVAMKDNTIIIQSNRGMMWKFCMADKKLIPLQSLAGPFYSAYLDNGIVLFQSLNMVYLPEIKEMIKTSLDRVEIIPHSGFMYKDHKNHKIMIYNLFSEKKIIIPNSKDCSFLYMRDLNSVLIYNDNNKIATEYRLDGTKVSETVSEYDDVEKIAKNYWGYESNESYLIRKSNEIFNKEEEYIILEDSIEIQKIEIRNYISSGFFQNMISRNISDIISKFLI